MKDFERVVQWRKAANQGEAEAQYKLGIAYSIGEGVPRPSYVEAVRWWRKAALQKHPDAQYKLSKAYSHGKGIAQNDAEAKRWLRKAAENGHPDAKNLVMMENMGSMRPVSDEEYFNR